MTTRLAISGFGRIGRMVLRAFVESGREDVKIVLINTPGPVEASAHLYEFDSSRSRKGGITFGEGWMDVGTGRIAMTHERDPAAIPHGEHGIDVVLECPVVSMTATHRRRILPVVRNAFWSAPASRPMPPCLWRKPRKISANHLVISNASDDELPCSGCQGDV